MRKWMWLLLLCLLPALSACAGHERQEENEEGILIHYVTTAEDAKGGDAVCGIRVELEVPENGSLMQQARAVVEKLMEEPAQPGLHSALPQNIKLLGVALQGRRVCVDFSSEFNSLTGVELTLANSCLVLSLSQLENINSVVVTVQGRPAVQQPQQIFYGWNVLLSDMDDVLRTVDVTLYFADETGALVAEERLLEVYEGQFAAENLVLELLAGPEDRELLPVFPADFPINSVRVENGVCHVNIPAASMELLPEDEAVQRLMLQSLVESLHSLDTVQTVRLLVDGEELELFGAVPVEEVIRRTGQQAAEPPAE